VALQEKGRTLNRVGGWLGSLLWAVACGPAGAAAIGADLAAYLERCDKDYSDQVQMLGSRWSGPGYHSTVLPGTWVHATRPSLDYALALLKRNAPADADRAARIIRKVISLQDVDPSSRTYGIWPWLLEEPLAKMSPPDWNWADFCGAALAEMLVDHPAKVPEDLKALVRTSLGHAARAIMKRNVGPGYTNIAIMGGGVTAAAGEILGDAAMLDYGRARLRKMVEHTAYHGSFNEYNSPTYTMVALREAERALRLVRDAASRQAAESLRRTAWQIIADSFNPGTHQWAGPHSRAYSDTISARMVKDLAAQCPSDLAPRFKALPQDPLQLRRTFIRGELPEKSIIGTTWHTAGACLGSVNHAMLWTQRRPLIAYWKGEGEDVVVLRLRFLHDGRDFASMAVATAQEGGRALSVFYPLKNHGDWHPSLDRPKDGAFGAADLCVRYELRGKGATAERLEAGRFVLAAGGRRAVIHTVAGRFDGRPVEWQEGKDKEAVFVDGICYRGEKKVFDFRTGPEVAIAAAMEILRAGETPAAQRPVLAEAGGGAVAAAWDGGGAAKLSVSTAGVAGD
jgi:hypothetical protein